MRVANARILRARGVVATLLAGMLGGLGLPTSLKAQPSDATPTPAQPSQAKRDEAAAISQVAASKRKVGEFALCADMYGQSATLDPGTVLYLYGEAKCAHLEGDRLALSAVRGQAARQWFERAVGRYRAFAAAATGPDTERFVAEARQQAELAEQSIGRLPLATEGPGAAAAKPSDSAVPSASTSRRAMGGWVLLGGGLAALGGGVLGVVAKISYDDYEAMRTTTSASGAQQDAAHRSAELQRNSAIAVAAIGLVALGVGAWLRWVADDDGASSAARSDRHHRQETNGLWASGGDRVAVEGR